MTSRDFFSVANNLGDSVAFNLESDNCRQRHQSCAYHGAGGRVRIHDKVARRAKNRIHQQREDRRIQAHHRLEADQFRIRDRRRQRYRRYRYAGHRIMPQPFPPISQQISQPRRYPQNRRDLFACDGRFLHLPSR
jgi:hypothetical protein